MRGNNPKKLHEGFKSFESADEKAFQIVLENEFMNDDQRDIWYTDDEDEARQVVAERRMS